MSNFEPEGPEKVPAGSDWESAVKTWFEEHKDYHYPDPFALSTGHYTQVSKKNFLVDVLVTVRAWELLWGTTAQLKMQKKNETGIFPEK